MAEYVVTNGERLYVVLNKCSSLGKVLESSVDLIVYIILVGGVEEALKHLLYPFLKNTGECLGSVGLWPFLAKGQRNSNHIFMRIFKGIFT